MASKGKGKRSVTNQSSLSTSTEKDKKSTRFKEDDREAIIFKVLTSTQVKELADMSSVDDVERKVMEIMKLDDYQINMKTAAILDYYTGAIWWAREEQFSAEQISLFFTMVHTLLENVKAHQMPLTDNLNAFKKMLKGIGVEPTDTSTGMDLFDVSQGKAISKYVFISLFQHYRMYQYVFSVSQAEEIIGTDLEVEVAPDSSIPWPPPLEESLTDAIYKQCILTPAPTPEVEETKEGDEEKAEEDGATEADRAKEADDLMAQLTSEEVKAIIKEAMDEVVKGLEKDVVQKLKEKENALLQRINKINVIENSL